MKVNLYSLVSLLYICFFSHFCFANSFRPTVLANNPTTRGEEFPKILEPNRRSDVNPRMARVVIAPIPGAKSYAVELNRKPDFKSKSIILRGEGHTFLFQNLAPSTKYYARAISDISTTYGPVTYFFTASSTKQTRLWGLTTTGGEFSSGTVFSFSTDSSTFTKHHDYQETNEFPNSYLSGSLVNAPDGGFFGTSECERNGTCANGEAFYISPEGDFELRYSLGIHAGSVTLTSDNNLYVVDDWINYFRGGIWKLNADSSGAFPLEKIVFKFSEDEEGLNPKTSLLEYGDYLYGVTPYGGKHNFGTIFRLNKNGNDFQVLHHFDGAKSGANPNGSLTPGPDGYLYGTTTLGGSTDRGLLFKISPDGRHFTRLYEFTGLSGKYPKGDLLHEGDVLFGMTSEGGNHDKGVLFSVKANGSSYKKLLDFNGTNGANPSGTPIMDDKKNLFGMTAQGGEFNLGVIFRIRTNGTAFSKVFDFSKESGGNPDGDLLLTEDSFRQPGLVSRSPRSADKVGLFPNPFIHTMTAQVNGEDSRPVKFILSDLQGNVLQEIIGETNSGLELGAALERGIYILKVVKDGNASQHRIVKK